MSSLNLLVGRKERLKKRNQIIHNLYGRSKEYYRTNNQKIYNKSEKTRNNKIYSPSRNKKRKKTNDYYRQNNQEKKQNKNENIKTLKIAQIEGWIDRRR